MTPTLFDAIDLVDEHADETWKTEANRLMFRFAAGARPFTADDLWAELQRSGVTTHEPRALGAVFRRAARDGIITPIGYKASTRPECHGRPVRVWVSSTATGDHQ